MKVKELMTHQSNTARMDHNLEQVSLNMWRGDFGIVPIIDDANKVIGVITDRDITMAEALQHRPGFDIKVNEVVQQRPVLVCHPDDDIEKTLGEMEVNKIRRLPVVDDQGHIAGMVSLADIAAYCGTGKNVSCTPARLVDAFKAIATPHTEGEKMVSSA